MSPATIAALAIICEPIHLGLNINKGWRDPVAYLSQRDDAGASTASILIYDS